MDRLGAIAYAQRLANLYGRTYWAYQREAFSEFYDVTTIKGETAGGNPLRPTLLVAECVSNSPLTGSDRLEEEVQSFLRTWR